MNGSTSTATATKTPMVSIIVPCFNVDQYLDATLRSILGQTYPSWECIIVDDGSTDSTPALISAVCKNDRRFVGVSQANGGRAKACNKGYLAVSSQSRYLFFLDSDDLLEPLAIETMVGYLESHSNVGLVACQFNEIDEVGRFIRKGFRSRWVPGMVFPRMLRDNEYDTPFVTFFCATGQGPFALFRRSVFEKTNGFEEALSRFSCHEDTDIFCQMALEAAVHYLPCRLYAKRIRNGQVTASGWRILESYSMFRRKWDHFQGKNPEQNLMLKEARFYYERWHKPCRSLRVGFRALGELIRSPSKSRAVWCVKCFSSSLQEFLRVR